MKGYARLLFAIVAAAAFAVSCGKDDETDTSSLTFASPALYFSGADESQHVAFSAEGVDNLYISSTPEGWTATLDAAARSVTVAAPTLADLAEEKTERSGSIVLAGTSYAGNSKSATLFVGITPRVDLSAKAANCYLVSQKETHYTFAPRQNGRLLEPASVGIVWQSAANLLQYVQQENGSVSFYVGADAEETTRIKRGNALVGAYDASGALIGSWHIWVADYDPEADALEYANGYRVMSRNLGALDNANTTPEERVASYGLFYQWGGKEPFVGPASYRANTGTSATMYDGSGSRISMTTTAATAETGTAAYAAQHPLCYITGVKETDFDWLWSADDARWNDAANNPCPHGWRIAPAGAFEGLKIANTPSAADYDVFGWTLTDDRVSSLYMGAGRRIYADGTLQNIYIPQSAASQAPLSRADEAQPWVGLYWTSDAAAGRQSPALYFWFEKLTATGGLRNGAPYARANGMPVRCVKE